MGLTPLDIHNKEFPRAIFGGYNRDAVEEFLDEVIKEFEGLIRENSHLKEQAQTLNQKLQEYQSLEETINRTLIVAQEASEDIKVNARKEADLLIQEARLQANRIVETGRERVRRIEEEGARVAGVVHTLRTQVRALLQSQLDVVASLADPIEQVAGGRQIGKEEAGHSRFRLVTGGEDEHSMG